MIANNKPQATLTDDDTNGNDADTYGWDNVFALTFTKANTAIASGWANVDSNAKSLVQAADDDPNFNINATFGAWQLAENGDGKNVRMACPIVSGTYAAGSKKYAFDNVSPAAAVVVEVNMNWVPDPGQFSFVINSGVDAIKADLNNYSVDAALQAAFSQKGKPLSQSADINVQTRDYEWLITDGSNNYYIFYSVDKDQDEFLSIYQFEKAWLNNLTVLSQGSSDSDPAVVIVGIKNNPVPAGIAADVLPQLLSDWFNTNIGNFNYVFSSLDLSPMLATNDTYKWLKPTATSYAVTDRGSLDSSIFGVLTMNLNHAAGDNHQVSPYAIPSGCDAGFLISGPMFMANMMLSGACAIFNNADPSNFIITNDGLTVTNTVDMVWGTFMMDNNKKGSISSQDSTSLDAGGTLNDSLINDLANYAGVTLDSSYQIKVTDQGSQWLLTKGETSGGDTYILDLNGSNIDVYLGTTIRIQKGNFIMTLSHTEVEIQFISLSYPYSSDFNVFVNYTENMTLGLNPQNVFWYTQVERNMVVSVVKTQSAITREIVEGAVAAALSLIAIAGPIVEGLTAASEVTDLTEDGGTAEIDEESFVKVDAENPDAAAENETQAASDAASQSKGKLTNIKAAFSTPKWKFAGSLAALAGGVVGVDNTVEAIIENAAQNKWEDVPGFDDFANQVIAPYSWPGVSGFSLKSASLAGSLQIGLQTR